MDRKSTWAIITYRGGSDWSSRTLYENHTEDEVLSEYDRECQSERRVKLVRVTTETVAEQNI